VNLSIVGVERNTGQFAQVIEKAAPFLCLEHIAYSTEEVGCVR
jgi:hypothetical protein